MDTLTDICCLKCGKKKKKKKADLEYEGILRLQSTRF